MVIVGFFKDTIFILTSETFRGGMDRSMFFNLADCYLDGKFVIPMMLPRIIRTSTVEGLRRIGLGVNNETGYKFNGLLTIEIEADGFSYIYESYSSSNEKYEMSNFISQRFNGNVNNQPISLFAWSSHANAYLVNVTNKLRLTPQMSFNEYIDYLCMQMDFDRMTGDYRTLHVTTFKELLTSINRVNDGDSTPVEESSKWRVNVIDDCDRIHEHKLEDIPVLTFNNASLWDHHLI